MLDLDFDNLDLAQAAAWISARPADAPFGYVGGPACRRTAGPYDPTMTIVTTTRAT